MPPINELGGCVLMLSLLSPLFISQQIVKTHQKGCWSTMFSSFWRASIQSFCFQVKLVSRWFIGKDSNQEKQVQDHLQIFKNRVSWSSRQCHSIAFLTFVILKVMSFNCFSYSQVKILLFGRVTMVKASKKGEAINTCYDKSKNDTMIHDPWSSYSV